MDTFAGWPLAGPALLAALAADNSHEFWAAHRDRHEAQLRGPMRALATALEPEFGPARVFRPQVNRRFRPDAPPYRTDVGCVAVSPGGCGLGAVLTATALSVSAGHRAFDGPQLRRYRAAAGAELADVLDALDGWTVDESRNLVGRPRGTSADHPYLRLLRHRGLEVSRNWAVGPWLTTDEPLRRVREAWRAAGPLVAWLDEHVGPAEAQPVRG
jgi:uncharacterized protein (DUF2461 family)